MKDACWWLRDTQTIIVRRKAAIGDCLAASVVADRLSQLGYRVRYECHLGIHPVMVRQPSIAEVTEPTNGCHVSLDDIYEKDPNRRTRHMHEMFMHSAGAQLKQHGIDLGKATNCKPSLIVTERERAASIAFLSRFPRPWVMVCPRSDFWKARQVPDLIWTQAAQGIKGSCLWLGTHVAPHGIYGLGVKSIDEVTRYLSVADLLVTVDTGPFHIGTALGIPAVAICQASSPDLHVSDQRDFVMIAPQLTCINCQRDICPINKDVPPCQNVPAQMIVNAVNSKLDRNGVSAVVAVYKPDAPMLNKCLESLLPQVKEIVVCRDLAGVFPAGSLRNPKIKYVIKQSHDIGYGRKANFGARHTTGKWILFCNDDAMLAPGAVQKMVQCADDRTGIVSPLLRYPNGMIYHAGKVRNPGMRGWPHIDHNKATPTFKDVVELENVCGCVILARRQAFYEAGCWDEDFYLFAEDDALCMQTRKAGWKILFNPHATGVHHEHQSLKKTPQWMRILNESNAMFGKKWGSYLDANVNRVPGTFDY